MNTACDIDLPELIKTQYLLKKINLSNNKKANSLNSENITRAYGRGMEYAESRLYQPGDDVRHIDWRLSARHKKTYTKLYHEEKGENNYVILDLSNSLYFGSEFALKSVIASKAAAMLCHLSLQEHNNLGSIIFNNNHINFSPTKLSRNNLITTLNQIVKHHDLSHLPINNNIENKASENYNLFKALSKFENLLIKNSRIFIISDFLTTDELLVNKIKKLSYRNMIYLIKISDPIEHTELNPGIYNISNGEDNIELKITKKNQNIFINFFEKKLKIFNKLKKYSDIRIINIESEPNWYITLQQIK